MIKSLYKFIIYTITLIFLFNNNSIAYGYQNTDTYRLTEKINLSSKFDYVDIELNPKIALEYFDMNQVLSGTGLSILLSIPLLVPVFLIMIILFGSLTSDANLFNSIGIYSSYIISNSLVIYSLGKNKSNKNYFITLIGSLTGAVLFVLLTTGLVFIESIISNTTFSDDIIKNNGNYSSTITLNGQSNLAKNQEPLLFIVAPFFISVVATFFYIFSGDSDINKNIENKEIIDDKLKNSYKEISDRLKISKNNISYSLIQF